MIPARRTRCIPGSTPLLLLVLALIMAGSTISCSDSEHRVPPSLLTTRVILDLGGSSGTVDGPRMSSAPPDITSISLTVAGPGMMPISRTYAPPFPDTINLSVQSGPARTFTAVAAAPDVTYSGTAVANLPAGETVSVPIVMTANGFASEGTPDEPILIPNDGTPVIGRVGTDTSYYYTDHGLFTHLDIAVKEMTDDADLLDYTGDNSFQNFPVITFGVNYCGRGKDEWIFHFTGTPPFGYYYFAVDGRHTANGAAYIITADVHGGAVVEIPVGSIASPLIVPVGLHIDTGIRSSSVPPYVNYYTAAVDAGKEYWINMYGNDPTTYTTIYQDPGFITEIGGDTFTATGSMVFFTASGEGTDNFPLEVTTGEGSIEEPVELYPDEELSWGLQRRANYCMVGGEYSSSYYRFPITMMGTYQIQVTSLYGNIGDVDLYVYSDPSFDAGSLVGSSATPGTGEESLFQGSSSFPDGSIYVEVMDNGGTGSTFILSVTGPMS